MHMRSITEHKETSMNDLKMSVALRICCAYTKKKLSSLKIHSMQMLKTTRKAMMQIMSWTTRMKKKMHEKDLMSLLNNMLQI